MALVRRYDAQPLRKVERTPQGGIKVEAALTRAGVFAYHNPDGSVRREYRPPEEVFAPESIASLRAAAVTNLHPPEGEVNAKNWRKRSVGHLSETIRPENNELLVGDVYVQDERTIALVEKRERSETSCGYVCKLDHVPGVTPQGEPYDAVQRRIRYNHVALVPRGRAGREVALRLDSEDNQAPIGAEETGTVEYEIINGTKYQVGTDAHRAAIEARTKAENETKQRLDSISALEGRVAALEAENARLRQDAADAPGKLSERVQARLRLAQIASRAGVEIREDADDESIQRSVIAKVLPEVKIEGKDAAFVAGVFESAAASLDRKSAARVRQDAEDSRRGTKTDERREDGADLPPDLRAREGMKRAGRQMGIGGNKG